MSSKSERWLINYNALKKFIEENNSLPGSNNSKSPIGVGLNSWYKNQVTACKNGELTKENMDLLNKILPKKWYELSFNKVNMKLLEKFSMEDREGDVTVYEIYDRGMISQNEYLRLLRKRLFYLSDILKDNRRYFTEIQIYNLIRNKFGFPSNVSYYYLYRAITGGKLVDIFLNKDECVLETIRNYDKSYHLFARVILSIEEYRVINSLYFGGKSLKVLSDEMHLPFKDVQDIKSTALKKFRRNDNIARFIFVRHGNGFIRKCDLYNVCQDDEEEESIFGSRKADLCLKRNNINTKQDLKNYLIDCSGREESIKKIKCLKGVGQKTAESVYNSLY